jgi:predicted DNA-binding transcriptional regulator YafY
LSQAVERLVNLALYLADARGSVTASDIREAVSGYPPEADEPAFKRMLERDKDVLRSAGLVIDSDDLGNYRLDKRASYVAPVTLSAEEAAAVRAAGVASLGDPSFPFAFDLRLALTKIAAETDAPDSSVTGMLADEAPDRQGELVAELASAAARSKRVLFDYTNSHGACGPHEIEPYGLFVHDGRWYLVGRDTARSEVRTYAVTRMGEITVNPAAPKTPDFCRPVDFDVASFIRLPFQYGPAEHRFTARLRFDAATAWRASSLAEGHGTLVADGDAVVWEVEARSVMQLARFVVEQGPGISLEAPGNAASTLAAGLSRVASTHA